MFSALDATYRPARDSPARPPARLRGGAGRGAPRQAAHRPDALRRRLLERLRGGGERRRAKSDLPLAPEHPAHPRLEHEAVHDLRGPGPLRERGHARHRGARDRRAGRGGRLPREPVPPRRRRPDLRQPPLHDQVVRRRGDRAGPRGAARRHGHHARHGPRLRRRVRLRLPARRPRLRLRRVGLGRPPQRAVVQPRPVHGGRARLPGEPARVRGRAPGRSPRGARRHRAAEGRGPAWRPRTRMSSQASTRRRWSA